MSIKNQVEAIIFLGGDENKIKDLARFFKISVEDMLKIILELKDDRKDSGINIEAVSYTHLDVYKRQIYIIQFLL